MSDIHPNRTVTVQALDADSPRASNASSHFRRFVHRAIAVSALFALCAINAGSSMPAFDGGSRWLASSPLQPSDLRGKVVLVDFWEYTCLNCLRTLPYLREWYKRYHDDGFVIVGVHSPEFGFSGEADHVAEAMKRLGITWPVVVDANHAIWNRYAVKGWPTELLFDQQGRLVATHVGEGDYPQTEREIQTLIRANNPHAVLPQPMPLLPQDSYDKPGAVCYPQSPEVLIEASRFANAPTFGNPGEDTQYSDRGAHKDGALYLSGYWHMAKEAVVFGGGAGYFLMPYHAIEVSVVMTPPGSAARVNVEQDGMPVPHGDAGSDIRYDGSGSSYVMVDTPRAYQVLMNQKFGQHELRLTPQSAGLAIYDVAFESCEVPR